MRTSREERKLKKNLMEEYEKDGVWWKGGEEERQRKELEKVWKRGNGVEDEEKENEFIPSQESNKSCIYDNDVLRNNNEDMFNCDENCDEFLCDEDNVDWD
ncbi:unnamed protein product [Meloidogyne enterolobii]|uniref:Uncharacterized protein n=1 Tax=Meloidogyne enterolobii TaxID=390850 RepID=A0ACB0ZE32_MELEN